MSDKPLEFPYVMVEQGKEPTLANSVIPNPIYLTTGECEYANSELEALNCSQIYIKLEEDDCDNQE